LQESRGREIRDFATLQAELGKLQTQQAELKAAVDQEHRRVTQWTADHVDVGQLMTKVVALKSELEKATKELATLPVLPEGFSVVAEYLQVLKQKEEALVACRVSYKANS